MASCDVTRQGLVAWSRGSLAALIGDGTFARVMPEVSAFTTMSHG